MPWPTMPMWPGAMASENKRWGIAPTVTFGMGTPTEITLGLAAPANRRCARWRHSLPLEQYPGGQPASAAARCARNTVPAVKLVWPGQPRFSKRKKRYVHRLGRAQIQRLRSVLGYFHVRGITKLSYHTWQALGLIPTYHYNPMFVEEYSFRR